ncbi:MAG: indole-3-glycerol phosphate synthase TrpC, partial [Candidatus Omnitrophica bacterium]|nr:indole-3-glycerol phosphate synthase TrpC [Candidatus Omnitrophota bacterium]
EAIVQKNKISLIAEIKKASPSSGIIRENFSPSEIARDYTQAGAQAISVLTEEEYFFGSIQHLREVREATNLPLLRKDFIFDKYQVYESCYFGADAILLIAEILSQEKLLELYRLAKELNLDCLVEAHTEKALKKILKIKEIENIGINNRNLSTLEVDLKTTERLYPLIPKEKIVVVESGIKSYRDLLFLKILGVKAVLIGEALMRAENIKEKVKEFLQC